MQLEIPLFIRTNLSISVSLLRSSILCFFSNSWIILWILLEINTLSFCAITIKTSSRNAKREKESLIKYLIVQSVASIMLVLSSLITKRTPRKYTLIRLVIISSLILKRAGAPLFQWFITVSKKISWRSFTILLTWQKLAPTYLLIFQKKSTVLIPIFASILTGAILIVNKTQVKEILAYSSLFNLRWMIVSIMIRIKTLLVFVFIYWSILILRIKPFKTRNAKEINRTKISSIPKETLFLIIVMLAGIPPLLGFTIKWIVIIKILSLKIEYLITLILVLRAINLFVYLRLVNFTTITYSKNLNKRLKKDIFFLSTTLIFINTLSFIIIAF